MDKLPVNTIFPLDLSRPITTRDGAPVRIICTDADLTINNIPQPLVGILGDSVQSWCLDGKYNPHADGPSDMDLVNTPGPIVKVGVEVRVCIIDGKRCVFAADNGEKFGAFANNPVAVAFIEMEYEDRS